MATNFMVKIGCSPSFVALAFQNGLEYCNFDFKRFNGDDLATSCKHLVNFSLVILEFTRVIGVHPLPITRLAILAEFVG